MSADKRWRLVSYDIRDPRRYREAYRLIRVRAVDCSTPFPLPPRRPTQNAFAGSSPNPHLRG